MTSEQFLAPLNILLQTHNITIDQLHQVRSILEVGIVRLAAQTANESDLAEMTAIVDEMAVHKGELPAFVTLDDAFHGALAKATHNPLVQMLAESIGSIMHAVRLQVHQQPMVYATTVPDHRAIVAGLTRHDADGAATAMQEHLEHARRFQQEYIAQEQQMDAASG
jgi:DNA-binding FadR family transcriptional regulator